MEFRLAEISDAKRLVEIYKPYVEKTPITFEYVVPSVEEFAKRIEHTAADFPYILAVHEGKIIGYAYAGRYRSREAYDWVVELSIYLDENERGHHAGTELYSRLLTFLKKLNYQRAYACITHPNPASHKFHEKFNFNEIGIMEKSGYKFEQWWGIEWMDLALQDNDQPKILLKPSDFSKEEIKEILS